MGVLFHRQKVFFYTRTKKSVKQGLIMDSMSRQKTDTARTFTAQGKLRISDNKRK